MPKYHLSNRMAAVAGLVPRGVTACDIGCDHGFVAIYLVEEGICPRVIAMDINKGPLFRAREHIESVSLSTYIDTRLSDGLKELAVGEAECMIAAGMGGRLIVKIMTDQPEKLKSLRYLVLQPQSEQALVRRFLRQHGFLIRKEDMVLEDGKFYPMMLAEAVSCEESRSGDFSEGETVSAGAAGDMQKGGKEAAAAVGDRGAAYSQSLEDEFGPCLIRERHPVLLKYLDRWEAQQNRVLKEVSAYPERRAQVEEKLAGIRDVRGRMEMEDTGGSAL